MKSNDQIALQVCTECCQVKPVTAFRRRFRNQPTRMKKCTACHLIYEKNRRAQKQLINRGFRMQSLATGLRKSKSHLQLMTFVNFAVAAAGGLQQLLADWHAEVNKCVESGRRTPRLMGFYEAIFHAVAMSSGKTGPADLTNPEQVRHLLAEALQEHPNLLADVAREAGWTVVQPAVRATSA